MRILPILGKFLISVGVGVLLFVAWTLWGTGISTHRDQNRLSDQFDAAPAFQAAAGEADKPHGPPKDYKPDPGEGVFRLKIPKIKLNDGKGYIVVEGVDTDDLAKGPGHYPQCRPGFEVADPPLCTEQDEVWPGERGRVIVSGHRTTHGAPFYDLEQLVEGNELIIETKWGNFVYEVTQTKVVAPDAIGIANPSATNKREIVLTTCNPRFSAAQRLIVFAQMARYTPV